MGLCPACGNEAVQFSGHPSSKFLIVEEAPLITYFDNPMDREITPRRILKKEMSMAGLELNDWQVVPVFMHNNKDNENCWTAGVDHIKDVAENKEVILLVGSAVCSEFTGYKVSTVCGLELDTESFPNAKIVMAIPSVRSAYGKGVGEIRHALNRLSEKMEKYL